MRFGRSTTLLILPLLLLGPSASAQEARAPSAVQQFEAAIREQREAAAKRTAEIQRDLEAREALRSELVQIETTLQRLPIAPGTSGTPADHEPVYHPLSAILMVLLSLSLLAVIVETSRPRPRLLFRLIAFLLLVFLLSQFPWSGARADEAVIDERFEATTDEAADLARTPLVDRAIRLLEVSEPGATVFLPKIDVRSRSLRPFRELSNGTPEYRFTLAALYLQVGRTDDLRDQLSVLLSKETRYSPSSSTDAILSGLAGYLIENGSKEAAGGLLEANAAAIFSPTVPLVLAHRLQEAGETTGIASLGMQRLRRRTADGAELLAWGRLANYAGSPDLMRLAWKQAMVASGYRDWETPLGWIRVAESERVRGLRGQIFAAALAIAGRLGTVRHFSEVVLGDDVLRPSSEKYLTDHIREIPSPMLLDLLTGAAEIRCLEFVVAAGRAIRLRDRPLLNQVVVARSPVRPVSKIWGSDEVPLMVGTLVGASHEALGHTRAASRYYLNTMSTSLRESNQRFGIGSQPGIFDLYHVAAFLESVGAPQLAQKLAVLIRAAAPEEGVAPELLHRSSEHPERQEWMQVRGTLLERLRASGDPEKLAWAASLPDVPTPDAMARLRALMVNARLSDEKEERAAIGWLPLVGPPLLALLSILLERSASSEGGWSRACERIGFRLETTRILMPLGAIWHAFATAIDSSSRPASGGAR